MLCQVYRPAGRLRSKGMVRLFGRLRQTGVEQVGYKKAVG